MLTDTLYARRIALALESSAGIVNDGLENASMSGYLKRIMDAAEIIEGRISQVLAQGAIPMVIPSSGSFGNNGALSGIVALSGTHAQAYLHFPANAIAAGVPAGLYYTVMSSTTAGTVYNNLYTSGVPEAPATPTPFVTTGPGAYSQVTSAIALLSVTIPGGTLGLKGRTIVDSLWTNNNNANAKTASIRFGGTSFFAISFTTLLTSRVNTLIANRNSLTAQVGGASGARGFESSSGAVTNSAVNTAADVVVDLRGQLAVATDTLTLEAYTITVFPKD